jgi:hypothetical protein
MIAFRGTVANFNVRGKNRTSGISNIIPSRAHTTRVNASSVFVIWIVREGLPGAMENLWNMLHDFSSATGKPWDIREAVSFPTSAQDGLAEIDLTRVCLAIRLAEGG